MLPDRVSNPGPLTYEPGALPTALRGPAYVMEKELSGELSSMQRDLVYWYCHVL